MSFSICSNITGLTEPTFRVDPSPDRLVSTFIKLLNEWSDRSYEILRPRYQCYLDQLNQKADDVSNRERKSYPKDPKDPKAPKGRKPPNKTNPYQDLHRDLESWLHKIPVLGFNSQNYDLSLIKTPLMKLLICANYEEEAFTSIPADDLILESENGHDDDDDFSPIPKSTKVRFTKKNNSQSCPCWQRCQRLMLVAA